MSPPRPHKHKFFSRAKGKGATAGQTRTAAILEGFVEGLLGIEGRGQGVRKAWMVRSGRLEGYGGLCVVQASQGTWERLERHATSVLHGTQLQPDFTPYGTPQTKKQRWSTRA